MTETCVLCEGRLDFRVLLPCEHNNVCLRCYMRNKICFHRSNCCICQNNGTGHPIVICDGEPAGYAQAKSRRPFFDSHYQLYYFDKEKVLQFLSSLFIFSCPVCQLQLNAFDQFARHVKTHKMRVCQICYASNTFLPGNVAVFRSFKDYQIHLEQQHPRCQCCQNCICFDQDALAKHMIEKHIRCDICAEKNKVLWFENPEALMAHNEKCHYVCHHEECIAGLVAFSTRGELLMHLKSRHHDNTQNATLEDFQEKENNEADESAQNEATNRRVEINNRFMNKLKDLISDYDRTTLMKYARGYLIGKVSVETYYHVFSEICGSEKDSLFNDMVAILPLPEKRAELMRIHFGSASSQPEKQIDEITSSNTVQNNSNTQNTHNQIIKKPKRNNKRNKRKNNQLAPKIPRNPATESETLQNTPKETKQPPAENTQISKTTYIQQNVPKTPQTHIQILRAQALQQNPPQDVPKQKKKKNSRVILSF